MATDPPVEEIPEPIPKRSDVTKAKRNVFLRHLAHEGIMIDRVNRNLHNAERLQTFAATGNTDDLKAPPEDDEMGVNIGNEYHYHGTQPPAPVTPAIAAVQTMKTASSWLPKALVVLSLLGGGTGIGYVINDLLKPVAASNDTDTDTTTEIDFPSGASNPQTADAS